MALSATTPVLLTALQDAFYTANKDYDTCVAKLGNATTPQAADACLEIAAIKFATIAGPAITAHILSAQVAPGIAVTTAGSPSAQAGATVAPGILT
jgi:hypothetical protein